MKGHQLLSADMGGFRVLGLEGGDTGVARGRPEGIGRGL